MCGQPFDLQGGTDDFGPSSAFHAGSLPTASAVRLSIGVVEHIMLANNTPDIKHVATGKEEAGSAASLTKKAAERQREVSSWHGYHQRVCLPGGRKAACSQEAGSSLYVGEYLDLSMNVTVSSLFLSTPIEKSDIYTSEAHGCCSRHGLNQHGVLPVLVSWWWFWSQPRELSGGDSSMQTFLTVLLSFLP